MKALETEALRRKPLNEAEQREQTKRDSILSHARQNLDEELDDVKHMNQMAMYAKCATIRDRQVLEKAMIREEAQREERRLNTLMEIDRVQKLREQRERDAFRQEEQRRGAGVILQQISEREQARLKAEEQRALEAQQMLASIKLAEQREEEARRRKVEESRRLLEEIKEANRDQARVKIQQRDAEALEDARIADYLRRKEQRELAAEEEQRRQAAERELDIARMRALQERAQDRQSQIDELRAQRYQEQKDRQWREQELARARDAAMKREELLVSREEQRLERAKRMAEEALREREEFERTKAVQQRSAAAERAAMEATHAQRQQYGNMVAAQMYERQDQRKAERQRFLEEGSNYSAQEAADKAKLLRIKQLKLAELEKAGVPEKYRAQLARKNVLVSSIH